jgi:RNA polymerase sigma-70 factor (ECF subfamily)
MNDNLKEEFLEVINNYQGILHKVSLIYFTDPADRKDNFQEILYQLWKAYPDLKKKESLGSWIYKISINTSIAKLRRESRYCHPENIPDMPDADDFFEKISKKEHLSLLLKAFHSLNEIDRTLMFLYLEENSNIEIAEIMGISVSNVGTKINRIKTKLKQILNYITDEK